MPEFSKTSQIALALSIPASAVVAYWFYLRWSSESEYEDKEKVATSHNIRIKVLVPRKAVGTVIGKQGATIKRVQAETGARLNFNDRLTENDGKPRVLMISGTPEMAQQAEVMVYQIIADMPQILSEQIEVPGNCVGRIIGKGGVIIRDLRRASGVRIDIDKDQGSHDNGMKAVNLSGSREQIDLAIDLIEEIVKKAEEEDKREKDRGQSNFQSPRASSFNMDGGDKPRRSIFKDMVVPREKGSIKASAIPVEEGDVWDEFLDEDVIGVGTVNAAAGTDRGGGTSAPSSSPVADQYLQVMVSAVEHPGHFWVQHVGSQSLHLEQMQKDITQQLAFEDARKNLAVADPQPGDFVAAKFEEDDPIFYRAQVLGMAADGKVDLYFVDYGDNAFADMRRIYNLRSEFQAFPHQAIQCQLAGVKPVDETVGWRDQDVTLFEDLVYCAQWKPLFAKVVTHTRIGLDQERGQGEGEGHKTEPELRPCLQLIDTSGDQDVNIAQELVRQGRAQRCEETVGSSSNNNSSSSSSNDRPIQAIS